MTLPARRPATYADIAALPEHVVGEILNGELVVSPRPAPRHADVSSNLGGTLIPPFRFGDGGPGGWRILDEPELHLGEDVLVPDLAGWRLERMPVLPEEAYFTLAPDWVCEVLSPSTSRVDRTRKLPICARSAIPRLWLVDPGAQTLEVYGLDAGRWVLLSTHGGDETVRAVPFDAVAIDLKRLWGAIDARSSDR
jgi:Uma2 family endonuclease